MALKAYIDESQTDGDVLIMAGLVASDHQWDAFSIEWEAALYHAGLEEFHQVDWGETRTELQGYFYSIAEKHAVACLAVAVPIEPLKAVAAEFSSGAMDANQYLFAFKALVNLCAQEQSSGMGIRESIDFIFDEKEKEKKIIDAGWKLYVNSIPTEERVRTGSPPQFLNSVEHMPLQAADLVAGWHRRYFLRERNLQGWPYPWPEKRTLAHLKMSFDEASYRVNFEVMLRGQMAITFYWNDQRLFRAWTKLSFQQPYRTFDPTGAPG